MNFDESVRYLYSFGNEVSTMKLGLENIRRLLAELGDPQNNYLKVQVAGTNGKGSVCAFLDAICREAGIKAGVFTSPHLVSITERVRIGGQDIAEDEFAKLATRVRETSEKLVAEGQLEYTPTFFEQITAIALLAFADAKVILAILETGLGGRLDATTAANAEIAAITRVDIDHQEYLGETIEEIAAEKAAIIRADTKAVIVGQQEPAAINVIEERCAEVGVMPIIAGREAHSLLLVFPPSDLGLDGKHQIENAEVAVATARILQKHFKISEEDIHQGLGNARHPGRLEWQGRFLFDGAHNVGGGMALREYLDEFVDEPITLVFGAMKGKDVSAIAKVLWPRAAKLIFTRPNNSRAMSSSELAVLLPEGFDGEVVLTESVGDALRESDDASGTVLVTGSLYLVGEMKKLLNN